MRSRTVLPARVAVLWRLLLGLAYVGLAIWLAVLHVGAWPLFVPMAVLQLARVRRRVLVRREASTGWHAVARRAATAWDPVPAAPPG